MGLAELLLHLALVSAPPLYNPSSPDPASPQLVALLQLRREDLPHDLRGEVYPVALFKDGSFRDARTGGVHPLTGEVEKTLPVMNSALDSIRDFTVYDGAAPIGRFQVTAVESAVYSCRAIQVGVGEMDLPERYIRFGRLDPRVQTFAVSGPGLAYQYTLNYYLALSRPVSQPEFGWGWDQAADPGAVGRLRDAIWAAGAEALAEGGQGTTSGRPDPPRWSLRESFRIFDLDRDGRPEGMGVVEVVSAGETRERGTSPALPRVASAIVWARDEGPARAPRIIAVLRQTDRAGREDVRRDLAEVMDLDGDGVAEIFYQVDGWEYHGFEIHALAGDGLEIVFAGGGYGC
ncbi:MAG TPA: hypothetical protein VM737_08495 [Gemmatimonadota bacterium]|nr:hypothetical protein [Gemmatimonadota bacterium]